MDSTSSSSEISEGAGVERVMLRVAVSLLVLSSGCAQTLRALPAKNAPLAEREAAFEELRADGPAREFIHTTELHLRDGTVLSDPAFLAPGLEPGSGADRALRSYLRSSTVRDVSVGVGSLSLGFSLLCLIGGLSRPTEGSVFFVAAGAPAAGLALINIGLFALMAAVSGKERDLVFEHYTESLRQRLDLH